MWEAAQAPPPRSEHHYKYKAAPSRATADAATSPLARAPRGGRRADTAARAHASFQGPVCVSEQNNFHPCNFSGVFEVTAVGFATEFQTVERDCGHGTTICELI